MPPPICELLIRLKSQQTENRWLRGDSYICGCERCICINAVGRWMKLEYLSCNFDFALLRNDLCHTSSSRLLTSCVPLKQIQEWLSHSDFSTTANSYAHNGCVV